MNKLQSLKKEIEKMSKSHQIEILRLCKLENNIIINENSNGTFINLTDLNEIFLEKLEKYVNYVVDQNMSLNNIENEKNELHSIYFNDS